MASSEQDKRLRAELAGLRVFPSESLGAEDVAPVSRAERDGKSARPYPRRLAPGSYSGRQWDHLKEERRRAEIKHQVIAWVTETCTSEP